MQMVVFKLGNEYFAVETEKVQTIKEIMKISTVPKAPRYIKGLINLRGSIISLVDLNMLLNVNSDSIPKNIIVLKVNDEEIGVTVDQVEEVINVEEGQIQNVESDKKEEYIRGVVNRNERLLTLIDIEKLLY